MKTGEVLDVLKDVTGTRYPSQLPFKLETVEHMVRESAVVGLPAHRILILPSDPNAPFYEGIYFKEFAETPLDKLQLRNSVLHRVAYDDQRDDEPYNFVPRQDQKPLICVPRQDQRHDIDLIDLEGKVQAVPTRLHVPRRLWRSNYENGQALEYSETPYELDFHVVPAVNLDLAAKLDELFLPDDKSTRPVSPNFS